MPIRCGSAEVLWKEDAAARVTRLVEDLGADYIAYESSKWGYGKLGEYVIGEVSFYRANGV